MDKKSLKPKPLLCIAISLAFAMLLVGYSPSAYATCTVVNGVKQCQFTASWSGGNGINIDLSVQPGKLFLKSCAITPKQTYSIYLPNSNMDTVTKLNSKTGELEWTFNLAELGKQLNLPKWKTVYDPSRTTVDSDNNVWVALRGGYHIVGISPEGKLLAALNIGQMPRAMTFDRQNQIWAGAHTAKQVVKIVKDGDGYKIAQTIKAPTGKPPICPYGATTDMYGDIWISSRCGGSSDNAVKIDANTGEVLAYVPIPSAYGIQADRTGHVWIASYSNPNGTFWKIDVKTNQIVKSYPIIHRLRGVTVDTQGNIWGACSHGDNGQVIAALAKLDPITEQIRYYGDVGNFSIGMTVDAEGYVWSVSYSEGRAFKTRISDGARIGAFPSCDITNTKPCFYGNCPKCTVSSSGTTNAQPYGYSDMTGFQVISAPPKPGQGTWRFTFDAKCTAHFQSIHWIAILPHGGKVTARARTAASAQDLQNAAWGQYVDSGMPLQVPDNRFIEVEFLLETTDCLKIPGVILAYLKYNYFPEVCDGKDNNCDGKIDGMSRPCQTLCGGGTETCIDGDWGKCSAPEPQPEVCNNLDDDCNGLIDDGLTKPCQTACGSGTETCVAGQWGGCTAPQPQPEICNNLDDDCNGLIDDGLTKPCQTACGIGIETCVAGAWVNCTAPQPKPEVCNGIDDDCNGLIDDGLTRSCQTACGSGTEICVAGRWLNCTAPQPKPEICNGKDDDCNGLIDDGLTKPCRTACGSGIETCVAGAWVKCTAPQPKPEVCNGKDDDCNGKIDDGLTRPCRNACGTGIKTCVAGRWVNCTAPKPKPEVCNGIDDDCNGLVDDGLKRPCQTKCGRGYEICENGQWVNCNAQQPKPEVCNGIDDDCNGKIDDGLTKTCETACGTGIETCVAGQWVRCTAPQPKPEVCNGIDDDCNGLIDDGLGTRPCQTVCGSGTESCTNGRWICDAPTPKVEECNGIDDDCNGTADDGIEPRECTSSCDTPGLQICKDGEWSECVPETACPGGPKPPKPPKPPCPGWSCSVHNNSSMPVFFVALILLSLIIIRRRF